MLDKEVYILCAPNKLISVSKREIIKVAIRFNAGVLMALFVQSALLDASRLPRKLYSC